MMTPPRKPRGEKPATTIRYLKRQIANLQASCALHRKISEDREKIIAGYDAQLSEARESEDRVRNRANAAEYEATSLREFIRDRSAELEFFRGYYAKSQETVSKISPIRSTGSLVAGDPTEAQTSGRPRDQESIPPRRQGGQSAGLDQGAAGFGSRLGDPLWRQQAHDSTNPEGRPLEHIEINDGISRKRFSLRNRGN